MIDGEIHPKKYISTPVRHTLGPPKLHASLEFTYLHKDLIRTKFSSTASITSASRKIVNFHAL